MAKFDVVTTWLNTVSFSHSGSKATALRYRDSLKKFTDYIGKTPQQIYDEYQRPNTIDKKFKIFYAQYLKGLIGDMQERGYSPSSIGTTVNIVKSFFKYSDLPLGFVPSGSGRIEFHNKDINRSEILQVMKIASPRERAFFCLMAQSGLRPSTIVTLKIKDVENILDENPSVPSLIRVKKENTKGKFSEYFTFVGKDSISNLKDYFKTRAKLSPEDYLFTMMGKEDNPLNAGVESHLFERLAKKLRARGVIDFKTSTKELPLKIETKNGSHERKFLTRSEFRLYNLRKFFRKYAGLAGLDFVNFWMGHLSACGVDLHYFSKEVEHHRQVYKEKAMPHLRLDSRTPSETERSIEELKTQLSLVTDKLLEKDKEIAELKEQFLPIAELFEKLTNDHGIVDLVVRKRTPEELETELQILDEQVRDFEVEEAKKKSKAKKLQE